MHCRGAISDLHAFKARIQEANYNPLCFRINEDDIFGDGTNFQVGLGVCLLVCQKAQRLPVYVCMYVCMYVCLCACAFMSVRVCLCVCVYVNGWVAYMLVCVFALG